MCFRVYNYEFHSYINLPVINHMPGNARRGTSYTGSSFCIFNIKALIYPLQKSAFLFIWLGSSALPDSRAEQQQHREYLQSACQHIEHQNIFRKIRKMSEIRHRSNQGKPRSDVIKG